MASPNKPRPLVGDDGHDEGGCGGGHGAALWMISYIDLLSLLLAFFVLLFTLSNVDKNKFKAITESVQAAAAKDASDPDAFKKEDLAKIQDDLAAYFKTNKLADRVDMSMTGEGLRISMSARFFQVGEDQLLPEGVDVLHAIALQVRYKTYQVRIEGHTDNDPIRTPKFPSNWFLSSARACSVIQYLQKTGLSPARLSAVGYADQRPLVPNDSPAGREKNRRVELIVLRYKVP